MADKTGRRYEALAAAIAAGDTVREAAERLGIPERSAYRESAKPEFRQRVALLRGEMLGRALGKLADMAATAVDKLRELLSAESEAVRLGAIRAALENVGRFRESVDTVARLDELEELVRGLIDERKHAHPHRPIGRNGSAAGHPSPN